MWKLRLVFLRRQDFSQNMGHSIWISPLLLSLPQEMILLGSGLLYPLDLLLPLGILFAVFDFLP